MTQILQAALASDTKSLARAKKLINNVTLHLLDCAYISHPETTEDPNTAVIFLAIISSAHDGPQLIKIPKN